MLNSILEPYQLPNTDFTAQRVNGLYVLDPGKTISLMDHAGSGCIAHIFISMQPKNLRQMVMRFYWDDEKEPSIECPVSDFFGVGHDQTTADLSSMYFYVAPKYGYNCYLPMPFSKRAKITLSNEGPAQVAGIYLMIDFRQYNKPLEMPWRLHAAWRRVYPAYRRGANFNLMEAKGDGRLAGVIYHACKRDSDDRWTHGGGDSMFIDGDTPNPTYIHGIGGEDFAHHAWGLVPGRGPFSGCHECHPVPGVKRGEGPNPFEPHGFEQHDGGRYSMYRFFVPDPIPFKSSMRLTFGTAANEISSTTYWYQNEPHEPFSTLADANKRNYGTRITEEETLKPINLGQSIPIAVLGPMMADKEMPWSPEQALQLDMKYANNIKQPYGDTVREPYEVRWRRSEIRGGFVDLAAIHRAKCQIRARGLWNKRHLPLGSWSHQLIRLKLSAAKKLVLRVGFVDRLEVWLAGKKIASLTRPEPQIWHTQDVPLNLPGGTHDIIIGNSQDRWQQWSAWGIYVKFLDENGAIVEGLSFEDFAKLDPTPEKFRDPWPPEDEIDTDDYRDPLMLV